MGKRRKVFFVFIVVIVSVIGVLFLAASRVGETELIESKKEVQPILAEKNWETQKIPEVTSEVRPVKAENDKQPGYDVIFCIDNSRSMWAQQSVRDEAVRSIGNLAVGSDIRIGGVYFARDIYKSLALTSMEDKEGSMKVLQDFFYMWDQSSKNIDTNIGKALKKAVELFEDQSAERRKIIILFSDGINENAKGEAEYKKSADALMKKQAAILQEKNIPLYCVYLQKRRNDEEVLKELVNYFDDENAYEKERFKKITSKDINLLSQQFANIFYDMQNNMKYRELTVDSFGKATFYVPYVGVKKLQLYVHNEESYGVDLACENDETDENDETNQIDSWEDGDNVYITVKNPTPGQWTLSINGTKAQKTTGTIAYYADLSASAELVPSDASESGIYKNSEVCAKVHFYDEDGKEMPLDSAAAAEVKVFIENQEGAIVQEETFFVSGNELTSTPFQITQYGNYRFSVKVVYEDFVNMEYSLPGSKVLGKAPRTFAQSGRMGFYSCEEGLYKEFTEEELFEDPEKEEVRVVNVIQKNTDNPIKAVQEKGRIKIIAEKTGEFACELQLEDVSGLMSAVSVSGSIYDRGRRDMMEKIGIIMVVLLIVSVIGWRCAKKAAERKKKRTEEKLMQTLGEQTQEMKRCQDTVSGLWENVQEINKQLPEIDYEKKLQKFKELCDRLQPCQREHYYVDEYLENGLFLESYKKLNPLRADIRNHMELVSRVFKEADKSVPGIDAIEINEELIKSYYETLGEAKNESKKIKGCIEKYIEIAEFVRAGIASMDRICAEIEAMLGKPIECTLLMDIGELHGMKVCQKHGGYIKGYYVLDQAVQFYKGGDYFSLKDILGDEETDILVYGYEDEEGNKGLLLESTQYFKVKSKVTGQVQEHRAVLYQGESYCLMQNVLGNAIITIK